MPHMLSAYRALRREYRTEFEVVFISSDRDIDVFEAYLDTMDWKALPYEDYEGERKKKALKARFKVAAIPTVVLFHRDPQRGRNGEFVPVPGIREARRLFAQPVDDVVAQFPKWKAQQLVLTLSPTTQAKYERTVSLVVLCEHLQADSARFRALCDAMEAVARVYRNELEARKTMRDHERAAGRAVADETWPEAMRFFVAPNPPNEATRFLRQQYAQLPVATAGEETLSPLILDLRTAKAWQACYAMRGVCEIEHRPPPTVAGLSEDRGKRLSAFVETFCNKMQPDSASTFDSATSPFYSPSVCTRIGGM